MKPEELLKQNPQAFQSVVDLYHVDLQSRGIRPKDLHEHEIKALETAHLDRQTFTKDDDGLLWESDRPVGALRWNGREWIDD